jgi:hypothetical protein
MRQKTVVCGSWPVDPERRQDSAEHLERQKCFEVRRGHDVEPRCRCCLLACLCALTMCMQANDWDSDQELCFEGC